MTGKPPEQVHVPISTLRRITGAEPGQIEVLIKARAISQKDGHVPLVAGVRAFIEAIRVQAREASLTAARDEARDARAEAAELDLLLDERGLVPEEDAQDALAAVCGAITSELNIIAARTTRDISVRRVVEDVLHELQRDLAQEISLEAEAERARSGGRKRKRTGQ
ncbi:hypothetical protein ACX9MO_13390 [Pseudooceanicola sp. 502str34]